MGSNPPLSAMLYKGILTVTHNLGTQAKVTACPDLARIVTVWSKLPAPLKAAILAIVNSSEAAR